VTIVDRQNTTAINSVVDRLQPTDFYDPTYGSIYAAMCDLHTKGSVVDLVTVADQLGGNEKAQELGGGVFLAEIAARVPTSSHIRQDAEILQEKKKRRQMIATGRQLAALGYDADTPLIDLMESAEQQFLQLTTTASTQQRGREVWFRKTEYLCEECFIPCRLLLLSFDSVGRGVVLPEGDRDSP
jgi:replicative DNA helicase